MLGNEKQPQSEAAGVDAGQPLTGGDIAISTQSTLQASACSGGHRVLYPPSSWLIHTHEPPYEQMLIGIEPLAL